MVAPSCPPRCAAGPRAAARGRAPRASCRRGCGHMWRRKLTASIVKWSSSPCSSQAAARTVRSKSLCSVSVGVKAVKSCVAGQQRRGGVEGGTVDGLRPPERTARLEGRADASAQEPVAVGARRRREARVEVRRGVRRRRSRRRPPAARCSAPSAARRAGGPPASRTLATCPVACTPVSVRPATASSSQPG